jgi:hypothetical protein
MEGFSCVTPVTGLNRPNTGKEDNDDRIRRMIQTVNHFKQSSATLVTSCSTDPIDAEL